MRERDLTTDGDAIITAMLEQEDVLDSMGAAFCSIAAAMLRAGVKPTDLHRLLDLATEAS